MKTNKNNEEKSDIAVCVTHFQFVLFLYNLIFRRSQRMVDLRMVNYGIAQKCTDGLHTHRHRTEPRNQPNFPIFSISFPLNTK